MSFLMYDMNTFDNRLIWAYLMLTENGNILDFPPHILLHLPVPTLLLTAEPHWDKCPCLFHTYLPCYFKLPSDTQMRRGRLF